MFGLGSVFNAFKRLTEAVNGMAERFEQANAQLDRRFGLAEEDNPPALPEPEEIGNGKVRKLTRTK